MGAQMKAFIAAIAAFISTAAAAGTFNVPYEKPSYTVAVPDKWNTNASDTGVDAAAPDRSTFLSISTFDTEDCTAARDDALKFLSRDSMIIDKTSATESASSIASRPATLTRYSGKADGKANQFVIVVAPLAGKRCIQIAQWGTPTGSKKNAAGVAQILGSIKLLGKKQP
jgi:hypothetical protein